MFEIPYDNKTIRNIVIAFGALFSKVKVPRQDSQNNIIQTVGVPIAYGPKEKIFVKLRQDPDLNNHIYTILPRMAFEITGYNYDPTRALNKSNQIRCYDGDTVTGVAVPVPYEISIQLSILTKGAEDGFAIIQQILPVFRPGYTMVIETMPEFGLKQEVPFTLNGVSLFDDYEGDFSVRRFVTHTLDFSAKIDLYGGVQTGGVITNTETTLPGFGVHHSEGDLSTGEVTVDFWMEEE